MSATLEKEKSKEPTPQETALEVLGANDVLNTEQVTVGTKTFTIEESTAYRFLLLTDIITDQAEALGDAGLLNKGTFSAIDNGDYGSMVIKIAKLWKSAPDVVGRFLAIVLGAEEEGDPDYILKNIKLRQIPVVLKAWMKVNAWGDLVDSFFQIGQDLRGKVTEIEAESESPTISSQ